MFARLLQDLSIRYRYSDLLKFSGYLLRSQKHKLFNFYFFHNVIITKNFRFVYLEHYLNNGKYE
jgi:hypothetical protein